LRVGRKKTRWGKTTATHSVRRMYETWRERNGDAQLNVKKENKWQNRSDITGGTDEREVHRGRGETLQKKT